MGRISPNQKKEMLVEAPSSSLFRESRGRLSYLVDRENRLAYPDMATYGRKVLFLTGFPEEWPKYSANRMDLIPLFEKARDGGILLAQGWLGISGMADPGKPLRAFLDRFPQSEEVPLDIVMFSAGVTATEELIKCLRDGLKVNSVTILSPFLGPDSVKNSLYRRTVYTMGKIARITHNDTHIFSPGRISEQISDLNKLTSLSVYIGTKDHLLVPQYLEKQMGNKHIRVDKSLYADHAPQFPILADIFRKIWEGETPEINPHSQNSMGILRHTQDCE